MAVSAGAVVGGVLGGILFLFLIGIAVYFLWKRKCLWGAYEDLDDSSPAPKPSCQSQHPGPAFSAQPNKHSGIPFVVPARFSLSPPPGLDNGILMQDKSEPGLRRDQGASFRSMAAFPLGSLDLDLYCPPLEECEQDRDFPEGNVGRLWFALEYRRSLEQLQVSLLRAANLPPPCESSPALVKLHLLPDERRHLQARAKHKGCSPYFNHSFFFQVSSRTLSQRVLRFSVFSVDRHKKHQLVGQVTLSLSELALREGVGRVLLWRDLEGAATQATSVRGDLQVSLNYNLPLQRLTVVVLRARGLQATGCLVQVSLQNHTRLVKSKRTGVTRGEPDPIFNETFSFKLPATELDSASITLELQPAGDQSRTLGSVVLGPFMFARGKELDHWNEMVSKPKEMVKQWHALTNPTEVQSPYNPAEPGATELSNNTAEGPQRLRLQ